MKSPDKHAFSHWLRMLQGQPVCIEMGIYDIVKECRIHLSLMRSPV